MALPDDIDVVIIGAGASGIAAINQIVQTSDLKLVCFETRSRFGGIWSPTSQKPKEARIEFDEFGHPFIESTSLIDSSPIYDGLRTNVPKQLMAYHRQPFLAEESTEFPSANQVSSYLANSAHGLESYVHFNHLVQRVFHSPAGQRPSLDQKNRRWAVQVTALSSPDRLPKKSITVFCDFVLAATGHYSVPYIPFVPSLWTWPKEIIHAFVYQQPSDPIFHQKTVAVIGIGPSGYDILRELAMLREHDNEVFETKQNKKIYSVASHPSKLGWDFDDPNAPSWTKLITTVPRFERIEQDKIYLVDGRILEDVDLLCFATGYLYSFPFCHSDDQPWKDHPLTKRPSSSSSSLPHSDHRLDQASNSKLVGGVRVHNLDQNQMFYYPDPSFACLVLNTQVVPFPLAEYQARAIAARWSGRQNFAIFPMDNEQEESRAVHALPPPTEFELENRLLDQIGEGGEIDSDQKWAYVADWKFKLRLETADRRKKELGY